MNFILLVVLPLLIDGSSVPVGNNRAPATGLVQNVSNVGAFVPSLPLDRVHKRFVPPPPGMQQGQPDDYDVKFSVNNSIVLLTVLISFAVYLAFAMTLNLQKWWTGLTSLYVMKWPPENILTTNPYLVTIVTGSRLESGTLGTVIFSIYGDTGSSDEYHVQGGEAYRTSKMFDRGCHDSFLVLAEEPLGTISHAKVALWSAQDYENWYLSYIIVHDVTRNITSYLPLHRWFVATADGGQEMMTLVREENSYYQWLDNMFRGMREMNIWISQWTSTILGKSVDSMYTLSLAYLTLTFFMFFMVFSYRGEAPSNLQITFRRGIFIFFVILLVTMVTSVFHLILRMVRLKSGNLLSNYSPVLINADVIPNEDQDDVFPGVQPDPFGMNPNVNVDNNGRSFPRQGGSQRNMSMSSRVSSRSTLEQQQRGVASRSLDRQQMLHQHRLQQQKQQQKQQQRQLQRSGLFRGQQQTGRTDKMYSKQNPADGGFNYGATMNPYPRQQNRISRASSLTSGIHLTEPERIDPIGQRQHDTRPVPLRSMDREHTERPLNTVHFPPSNSTSNFDPRYQGVIPAGEPHLYANNSSLHHPYGQAIDLQQLVERGGSHNQAYPQQGVPELGQEYRYHAEMNRQANNNNRDESSGSSRSSVSGNADRISSTSYQQVDNFRRSKNVTGNNNHTLDPKESSGPRQSTCHVDQDDSCHRLPASRDISDNFTKARRNKTNERPSQLFQQTQNRQTSQFQRQQPLDPHYRQKSSGSFPVLRPGGSGSGTSTQASFEHAVTCSDSCNRYFASHPALNPDNFPHNSSAADSSKVTSGIWRRKRGVEPGFKEEIAKSMNDSGKPPTLPSRRFPAASDPSREQSWSNLWNAIKPVKVKDDDKDPDEIKAFVGQLVENIIQKIKTQLAAPNPKVDLSDCEGEMEAFVSHMTKHLASSSDAKYRPSECPDGTGMDQADRKKACSSVVDRLSRCLTENVSQHNLAMINEKVATIVSDVEKVRKAVLEKMCNELGVKRTNSTPSSVGGSTGRQKKGATPSKVAAAAAVSTSASASCLESGTLAIGSPYSQLANALPPEAACAMNDKEIRKVARVSLDQAISGKLMSRVVEKTKPVADDDLTMFANEIVHTLYDAVRSKLEAMLRHDPLTADSSSNPFATEELLTKTDKEVKEQILPSIVEHIAWLMKEEARTLNQMDCDMMMIAFAGQYVDTIVTNAVLKTHIDLTRKKAYTRTFTVTSRGASRNSDDRSDVTTPAANKNACNNNINPEMPTPSGGNSDPEVTPHASNNNNNNNDSGDDLDSISCAEINVEYLRKNTATRLQVDEVLRYQRNNVGDYQLDCRSIIVKVVDELLRKTEGGTQLMERKTEGVTQLMEASAIDGTDRSGQVGDVSTAEVTSETRSEEEGEEGKALSCDICRNEIIENVVDRWFSPVSMGFVAFLVLEEADQNLEMCGEVVEERMIRCSQDAMVELGRALLDSAKQPADIHMSILDSVTMDLENLALDQAVATVVGRLLLFHRMPVKTAHEEIRKKLGDFRNESVKKAEEMMLQTAIRANFEEQNKRAFTEWNEVNANRCSSDDDESLLEREDDAKSVIEDVLNVRSLLEETVSNKHLFDRCNHNSSVVFTNQSNSVSMANQQPSEQPSDQPSEQPVDIPPDIPADLNGADLSHIWPPPKTLNQMMFKIVGIALFVFVILMLAGFNLCCLSIGVSMTRQQAIHWLAAVYTCLLLQIILAEPLKLLAVAFFWTVVRKTILL